MGIMTKYYALIEFIKTEYLDNAHVNIGEDIPDAVKNIKDEFDIKVCQYDGIQYRHVKQYEIKSKNDGKKWNIIVGPVSLLYAANLEKYRAELLSNHSIEGVFTLKNAFFRYSSIPTAVIVLGDVEDEVWLTSAISTDDVISLMKNIHTYSRKVYFTKELNAVNFMPEYYNGELNEVNSELDKYETKELQEIAEIINGKNAKPDQLAEEGIPYLRGRNLQQGKIVDINDFVVAEAAGEFSKQLLEEGDILLQKQFGYHKIARVTADDLPAIASSGLFIIRAYGVPEDYLYSYLTSETGKAIFEKQLKSIERGATIVSIGLADLKKLRVPMFDQKTMQDFSRIDDVKVEEIAPTFAHMNRLMKYAEMINSKNENYLEAIVVAGLIKVGWTMDDIKIESEIKGSVIPRIRADIVLMHENNPIAIMEVKSDMSRVTSGWIEQVKAIMGSADIPITILTLGSYFEIHVTKTNKVVKQDTPPTKNQLLSLINGKEEV